MNEYKHRKGHGWQYLVSFIILVLTVALVIAVNGCAEEGMPPPGEEEMPAAGIGTPSEEEPAGEGVPAEGEPAAGVSTEEEAAGEAAATPSLEAVTVDIELEIESTNPEGTKFVAPESGSYKLTIIEGAYTYWETRDPEVGFLGWRTLIGLYKNRPAEWGAPDEWGLHPINPDNIVGLVDYHPTFGEAEAAGRGSSITVHLAKNDYIIIGVADGSDWYHDNSGSIRLRITGPHD